LDSISSDRAEVIGYTAMVLAFLLIFFGVRSYRDNVAGGFALGGRRPRDRWSRSCPAFATTRPSPSRSEAPSRTLSFSFCFRLSVRFPFVRATDSKRKQNECESVWDGGYCFLGNARRVK
jgi:hypothetical protein